MINRAHFFHSALHKPKLIEEMLEKLELLPPDKIPYLFPGSGINAKGQNAFNRMIDDKDLNTVMIKSFIKLMTMSDPKGYLYQKYVDREVAVLLHNRIDIKNYFISSMPLHSLG